MCTCTHVMSVCMHVCPKAMEFSSFWHPSHSILACIQNGIKNPPLQTSDFILCLLPFAPPQTPPPPPFPFFNFNCLMCSNGILWLLHIDVKCSVCAHMYGHACMYVHVCIICTGKALTKLMQASQKPHTLITNPLVGGGGGGRGLVTEVWHYVPVRRALWTPGAGHSCHTCSPAPSSPRLSTHAATPPQRTGQLHHNATAGFRLTMYNTTTTHRSALP